MGFVDDLVVRVEISLDFLQQSVKKGGSKLCTNPCVNLPISTL